MTETYPSAEQQENMIHTEITLMELPQYKNNLPGALEVLLRRVQAELTQTFPEKKAAPIWLNHVLYWLT